MIIKKTPEANTGGEAGGGEEIPEVTKLNQYTFHRK